MFAQAGKIAIELLHPLLVRLDTFAFETII